MSRIRTVAALACLALGAACVPAQGDQLGEQIQEDPTMLKIVDRGELRIGIPVAPEGIGTSDSGGLTREVGTWVADALGVEASFEYLDSDQILAGIRTKELDLGFPVTPMTEAAVKSKERSYTAPYFVAHQRLLLASGQRDPGSGIPDDVEKTCVFGDPKTQIPIDFIDPDLIGIRANDGQACARMAATGIVQAIAAPDLLLFELEAQLDGSSLGAREFNTEGYGAIVQYGETGLANFFDAVLARAIDDGRWKEAWDDNVGPLTEMPATPPDLTAEEAAALFPRGLSLK